MKVKFTVEEAAERLNVSPAFLRIALQQGIYPFGFALKSNAKNKRFSYYINAKKLEEYIANTESA